MWMNPLGRHFGMLTAGDMICLDIETGRVAGGNTSRPANAAGYLIHSAVHKRRPDDGTFCFAYVLLAFIPLFLRPIYSDWFFPE